ncbi:MAG TPA: hypothetical protein VIG64_01650 [Actinomycetota bacterium]|jgi:hypothetical protein
MKKLIGLIAVTAIVGAMLVPATSASAAQAGKLAAACQVTLTWPGSGSTSCGRGKLPAEGLAVGVLAPSHVCVPSCGFEASVDSYSEECFAGEPPLLGEASGTFFLNGSPASDYDWVRVGGTAVVTLNPVGPSETPTGGGTAAFVPEPPLGTCAAPNPAMVAHVAGEVTGAEVP